MARRIQELERLAEAALSRGDSERDRAYFDALMAERRRLVAALSEESEALERLDGEYRARAFQTTEEV